MRFTSRARTRLGATLLVTTLALTGLTACGSDSSDADEGEPITAERDDAGDAPAAGEELVIRFADPGNHGIIAYAKKNGSFDEALAEVNARIEWVPAAGAFSANFDLLKSGEINTHEAAVSPVIGALTRGLDFKIFSISEPQPGRADGIVATPDSGIETVEDLEGRRVAVNAKAHGEWLLLKALEEAGVDPATVERVPIQPPDAAAAFASGQIDAWATFGSFFATAIQGGGVPIVYSEDYEQYDDVGIIGASTEALEANPAAFATFVEVYAELSELAHERPEDFVNVFNDSGPDAYEGEVYELAVEDARTQPIPHIPGPEDIARVERVLQLFVDNGVIDGDLTVEDVVFDAAAAQAAQAAQED
ncbi:MAG TPA: NrtA/SsuA/CpmA family ABC transporter substrate-binding protein [Acidimicrobiales bacterium]